MQIFTAMLPRTSPEAQFEFVERKGLGHPDTVCDAIAETASRRYAKYCLERYGGVAHHWFDKTLLIGGESSIDWGIGEIIKPYIVVFHGKVTKAIGQETIPYKEILADAAAEVLEESLVGFDKGRHVAFEFKLVDYHGAGRANSRYRPTSPAQLARPEDWRSFVSNDCNLISAYWPLSKAERLALHLENTVNSIEFKIAHPSTGTDVKVFVVRADEAFTVTINVPFLAGKVESRQAYDALKAAVERDLRVAAAAVTKLDQVTLLVNPQDRTGKPYLTALGSAADTGDVGVVGRGNRGNGLITPMRPMSIEAPAGKNPTDHTGKIYTKLAIDLAQQLSSELQQAVEVHIFTAKESPLHDPDAIVVRCEDVDADIDRRIRNITYASLAAAGGVVQLFVSDPGVVLW